jgi:PAS domain S-box-containing protein
VPQSNERYRRLVELSPDGILITSDTRIVFVNPAAVRLFGAESADQLLGRVAIELFHPDHHSRIHTRIARVVEGETVPLESQQIVRLDGTVVDVEVTSALLDGDGSAIQVIVRDVSERKRAEDALRESEERLRLAFAGAQEGVWDWNLETDAVVYSARWKEMLGYGEEEIAPHISAWESLLHPEDRGRAERAQDAVARGETTYQGEFRLRHKSGHYIHVLSRGFPVRGPGGTVVRIVGTHFDLTERRRTETTLRESEERLTLAFAGAQEGVWDWNLETDGVVYSARWKEMLGYEEDEIEPHIRAWERLLHPDDRAPAAQVHDAVMHGAPTYEGEFRLRHKDGHYVQVLSRGFPVRREPGGPVVRIVGTHFDLTARKRAEAERARTELLGRLLFAQEDERKRIAREMHDQFGEHLTALGHGIARLKDASAHDPALRSQVDAIESIAQRLDRDVDHLVWDLRPTALDDLGLRAALTNYVNNWSARVGIPAELHTSGLSDHRLTADAETALYRIAQEALTNVAKHSRASHVDVILERRSDHVLLIIEDDGVGFEAGETGAGDRGFGLLGMQERAALVGASLEIESSAGQGTTILVRMSSPTPTDVAAHA